MTPSSGNKSYSAADIERYHAGKMTPAERHALEKAAMDDPFLSDALEGYMYTSTPAADLEKITQRLEGYEDKKRVFFLFRNRTWLSAAAILLFIAAGSWLALQWLDRDSSKMALEQNQEETARKSGPVTNTQPPAITQVPSTDSVQEVPTPSTAATESRKTNSPRKPEPVGEMATAIPAPEEAKSSEAYKDRADDSRNKSYWLAEKTQAPATSERTISGNYQNNRSSNAQAVPGLNQQNQAPVMNQQNQVTPQNQQNRFAINQQNNIRDYNATHDSAFMDRTANRESLASRRQSDTVQHLNVVLQPTNEGLSEVVVLSKKQAAARKITEPKVDTLEPTIGWAKFDEYIANNITAPEELKTKQMLSREVELVFDVNSNGDPVNITVAKSLCASCDQEAIRLLREGPKWKKKKNRKGKVTIRF